MSTATPPDASKTQRTSLSPQRVSLITLGVADLEISKTFYADLGWVPEPGGGESIIFHQLSGLVLGLFPREGLAKDQNRPAEALGTGAITLAQNMPDRESVDDAYRRALQVGATPLKAPEPVFRGGYSEYYADPDDHVWEVAYNPYWPLDEDGSLTLPPAN
ncbi:MAG TPA: glyoxalase [Rhodobacteraceae bacterium]|nr:glyoxalase [Paracoccaceae bacterium]